MSPEIGLFIWGRSPFESRAIEGWNMRDVAVGQSWGVTAVAIICGRGSNLGMLLCILWDNQQPSTTACDGIVEVVWTEQTEQTEQTEHWMIWCFLLAGLRYLQYLPRFLLCCCCQVIAANRARHDNHMVNQLLDNAARAWLVLLCRDPKNKMIQWRVYS